MHMYEQGHTTYDASFWDWPYMWTCFYCTTKFMLDATDSDKVIVESYDMIDGSIGLLAKIHCPYCRREIERTKEELEEWRQ